MNMVLLFRILAVILFGIAAFFLWKNDTDAVFVSAVLAIIAYLIGMRFQVRARIKQRSDAELDSPGPKG